MRVICIDDDVVCLNGCQKSILRIGGIYNVTNYFKDEEGEFYELAEEKDDAYATDLFIPLSNIDETELVNEKVLENIGGESE